MTIKIPFEDKDQINIPKQGSKTYLDYSNKVTSPFFPEQALVPIGVLFIKSPNLSLCKQPRITQLYRITSPSFLQLYNNLFSTDKQPIPSKMMKKSPEKESGEK